MIVIHGLYRFAQKRLAFRNDFCLACEAPRLAIQVRSFNVVHLYWIPVLPLGLWRRWCCSTCGRNPHERVRTKRFYKVLLVLMLALMALPFWFAPLGPEAPDWVWPARVLSLLAVCGAIWWATYGHRAGPSLRERLASVSPYQDRTCPLCGGTLFDNPRWHCPACGVERVDTP